MDHVHPEIMGGAFSPASPSSKCPGRGWIRPGFTGCLRRTSRIAGVSSLVSQRAGWKATSRGRRPATRNRRLTWF